MGFKKDKNIKKLFSDIAVEYDVINNIISLGLVHLWRRKLIKLIDLSQGSKIIDLCSGTGKVTSLLAAKTSAAEIIGVDFCPEMIEVAQNNMKRKNNKKITYKKGNILNLDFPDDYFDCAVSAFGLRNIKQFEKAISEMKRIVKPGGKVLVLELVKPEKFNLLFKKLYYIYLNKIIPGVGKLIHGKKKPYIYLAQSIKEFLGPIQLYKIFCDKGFKVKCYLLSGGITAIYYCEK